MCDRYRADVASPSSLYRWYREPGSVLLGTDLENFPGVSANVAAGPRCVYLDALASRLSATISLSLDVAVAECGHSP
jgi:hypothetical protein